MGFRDTFKFNELEYRSELIELTDEGLYIEHERHSFLLLTNYMGAFGCLGCSVETAGITLLGTAFLGRQVYVCARKVEIIVEEMKARRLVPNVKPYSGGIGQTITTIARLFD